MTPGHGVPLNNVAPAYAVVDVIGMEKGLAGVDDRAFARVGGGMHQWVLIALIIVAFGYMIFFYSPASPPGGAQSNLSSISSPSFPVASSPANNSFGLAGSSNGSLLTNFEYIDGLNSDLNLFDSWTVLNYIFANLPDRVVVYPTENYFYFRFTAHGYNVKGSFSLFAKDRDTGHFGMGYIVYDENPALELGSERIGNGAEYTDANGVFVKKISDFEYDVTVENKTVKFILNDVGLAPPHSFGLLPEEKYIGTTFDESGLNFFLLYNQKTNRVYWVLDEDVFVPEQFHQYLPEKKLIRGNRTDLVFFHDVENKRKLLVGAKGENVLANNWYDGPFDQMPDNYVKTGKINYDDVVRAYYATGRVDEYLGYTDNPGARIAVAPYTVYFSPDDFSFIGNCMVADKNMPDLGEKYACMTVQQYNVPYDRMQQFLPVE